MAVPSALPLLTLRHLVTELQLITRLGDVPALSLLRCHRGPVPPALTVLPGAARGARGAEGVQQGQRYRDASLSLLTLLHHLALGCESSLSLGSARTVFGPVLQGGGTRLSRDGPSFATCSQIHRFSRWH